MMPRNRRSQVYIDSSSTSCWKVSIVTSLIRSPAAAASPLRIEYLFHRLSPLVGGGVNPAP